MATPDTNDGFGSATVRSIVLPQGGDALLLPGAVLVEVLATDGLRALAGGPDWLIGTLDWRGHKLPIVWLDGGGAELARGAPPGKLAVVYALSRDPSLKCYAIYCTAVPKPVVASEMSVRQAPAVGAKKRLFVREAVRVDGEVAYIPDLDALEAAMLDNRGLWSADPTPPAEDVDV